MNISEITIDSTQ